MAGYHEEPADGGASLSAGWLRTGDLARRGRFGTVTLAGRKKDVIKVGGYSVFPAEIEEEIRRHPAVADAAVVGLPDARLGEVPAALIVPIADRHPTPVELASWARSNLAAHRRPRRWLVVEVLPRHRSGKIDIASIRRLLSIGLRWLGTRM